MIVVLGEGGQEGTQLHLHHPSEKVTSGLCDEQWEKLLPSLSTLNTSAAKRKTMKRQSPGKATHGGKRLAWSWLNPCRASCPPRAWPGIAHGAFGLMAQPHCGAKAPAPPTKGQLPASGHPNSHSLGSGESVSNYHCRTAWGCADEAPHGH